ncbi:hypothetical protein B0H14DRAFT_2896629, partial [Mycena olivaceomarginata]
MRPVCPSTSLCFLLTTECLLPVKPSSCPAQISSARNARGAHPRSPPRSKLTHRACQHQAWVDGWGIFGHLDVDVVIKKIADIIMD